MQKELAIVLRNKIKGLPFVDVAAGIAQVLSTSVPVGDGPSFVGEREPVSYDVLGKEGQVSMVPNGKRKSVIYFEDNGIQDGEPRRQLPGYIASIRLVCWMNKANLVGDKYANITGRCIAAINQKLTTIKHLNVDIFQDLTVTLAGIPRQDAGIFSRYTYKEQDRQYLRPPFEFFAIDYTCTYFVNPNCLSEIGWTDKTCY